MLEQAVDHTVLFIWLSVMVVINLLRLISARLFLREEKQLTQYQKWDKVFFALMILTALCWGSVSIWLLPDDDSIFHYLPILVLIGVSAGAVTSLGFKRRNLFVYFLLLLVPILIIEFSEGTYISTLIGCLLLMFIVVALTNASKFSHNFKENIRLRYLSEVNEKELIASKNAAIEANSAKSNFISMISHELRTPLNAILGFGQLLKMSDSPKLNDEQEEQTQGIIDSGQHLLTLIEELLELSKIESNKLIVENHPVILNDVLIESLSILNPIAAEHGISINNEITNDYVVKADHKRLKQIFINLIANAIKYNHNNGKVNIHAAKLNDNRIKVEVSDNGQGIHQEQLSHLFDPFERFDLSKEGLGLGLYISKNLVELMDGAMGVESEIGKGSKFWIELNLETPKN